MRKKDFLGLWLSLFLIGCTLAYFLVNYFFYERVLGFILLESEKSAKYFTYFYKKAIVDFGLCVFIWFSTAMAYRHLYNKEAKNKFKK